MAIASFKDIVGTVDPVDVTMSEDYVVLPFGEENPILYEKDHTYRMDVDEAYQFVRFRDLTHLYTNPYRMARGKDFVTAFMANIKKRTRKNPFSLVQLAAVTLRAMDTDLTPAMMAKCALVLSRTSLDDITFFSVEGEEKHGRFDEFYPDEQNIDSIVRSVWYQ